MTRVIDINCDVGEGFGIWELDDDNALLDLVTSANVACGFHGGDPSIMRRVCQRAADRGVVIGAQVGYHDLVGFGRRMIDMPPEALTNDVLYQLGALEAFCRVAGTTVRYVKPHGALYNRVIGDPGQARSVVEAVLRYDPRLSLLCPPGSVIADLAGRAGITVVAEAFADRAYTDQGALLPRTKPGAVIHDIHHVTARCLDLVIRNRVISVSGLPLTLHARSLCVHGDTPGAADLIRAIRATLRDAGVRVEPFHTRDP